MAKHTNDTATCPSCEEKLKQAHPSLCAWFKDKVKVKFKDAHISWSYRDQVSQNQAYAEGKSKLPYPKSAHNLSPSTAIDLFRLCSNGMASWEYSYFRQIFDMNTANGDLLKWGGNWKSLGDFDHFELDPA